jgi:hypothetical protein
MLGIIGLKVGQAIEGAYCRFLGGPSARRGKKTITCDYAGHLDKR